MTEFQWRVIIALCKVVLRLYGYGPNANYGGAISEEIETLNKAVESEL